MAIIYSYPATAPTLDDLLIGTDVGADNATKSFTVQSLVALVNAAAGNGTVTSVQLATDAFLTATGGPIVDAGTITVGFSATGTPSATTFLRGDNQWVVPTVTSGIITQYNNANITTDLASINFTGAGVIANSDASGNVTVSIEGATQAVSSVAAGAGISIPSTTGDVVVTNTGVLRIIAGSNVTISPATGLGDVTVNSTATGGTDIGSVSAGNGLVLDSGTTVLNPVLGLNYGGAGVDNYITSHSAAATALGVDSIPFLQASSSAVKYTTLANIQASTLSLVNTAITDANEDAIVNTYDKANQAAITNGVAPAYQIVTLTQGNYDALVAAGTTDANYLYFTKAGAAAATFTRTLAITLNISGNASSSYSLSGSQVGAQQTGVLGAAYAFATTISNTGNTTISGVTINNASGTQTDPSGGVTTTITATINNIVAGTGTANVSITNAMTINDGAGASGAGIYTIAAAQASQSGTAPFSYNSNAFGVAITQNAAADAWEIISPSVSYNPQTGTVQSGQVATVTATATGTVRKKSRTLEFTRTTGGITGGTEGTDYTLSSSGTPGLNGTGSGATATPKVGDAYSYSTTISMIGNKVITGFNGATAVTGTVPGGAGNYGVSQTLSGAISSSQGTASMTVTNSVSGSAEGTGYTVAYSYSISGGGASGSYTPGQSVTGTVGANCTFTTTVTAASNYYANVTQSYTTNPIPLTAAGAATALTLTGSSGVNRRSVFIAGQGGTPGPGGTACGRTQSVQIWFGSALSSYTGVQNGDTLYTSEFGNGVWSNGIYKTSVASGYGTAPGTITVSGGVASNSQFC